MTSSKDSFADETRNRFAKLANDFIRLASTIGDPGASAWLRQKLDRSGAGEWAEVVSRIQLHGFGTSPTNFLDTLASDQDFEPADFQFLLASHFRDADSPVRAEASLRTALRLRPQFPDAAFALAGLLREQARLDTACDVLKKFAALLGPGDEELVWRSVVFLRQCQRTADALSVCSRAFSSGISTPALFFMAGELELSLGRFEDARTHLEVVADQIDFQDRSFALHALSDAQRYADAKHPDFQRLKTFLADPLVKGRRRASVLFALGKACDDVGDWANAAAAWREANEWVKQETTWLGHTWSKFVEGQIQAPRPAFALPASEDFIPVFIVGLPRSGTTLISQFLARHPKVRTRGETNWLPYVWEQLSLAGLRNDPVAVHQGASIYRMHVHQDDERARWYVDKNPLNFRYLNLLVTMFPNARIIHCRRDLRDNALSLFAHYFSQGQNEFAYDWADIDLVGRTSERLMDHWKKVLPLSICTVDYEQMVAQPRETLLRLANYLDLPSVDELMDDTGASDETIVTSSRWQARQPLYGYSVGRAQAYASHFPELVSKVGA